MWAAERLQGRGETGAGGEAAAEVGAGGVEDAHEMRRQEGARGGAEGRVVGGGVRKRGWGEVGYDKGGGAVRRGRLTAPSRSSSFV
jgi:hypothetical protein